MPRIYSRAQRDAMLALSTRGLSSRQISERLAEGYEALEPCHIPARSVRQVIQAEAEGRQSRKLVRVADDPMRSPIFKRLARAEPGFERDPGRLYQRDAEPCDGYDKGWCDQLAVIVKPDADGRPRFWCQVHLERQVEAEPVR